MGKRRDRKARRLERPRDVEHWYPNHDVSGEFQFVRTVVRRIARRASIAIRVKLHGAGGESIRSVTPRAKGESSPPECSDVSCHRAMHELIVASLRPPTSAARAGVSESNMGARHDASRR